MFMFIFFFLLLGRELVLILSFETVKAQTICEGSSSSRKQYDFPRSWVEKLMQSFMKKSFRSGCPQLKLLEELIISWENVVKVQFSDKKPKVG